MLTLIFGIWASEPPRAWQTTEKAGPDRVKQLKNQVFRPEPSPVQMITQTEP